MAKHFVCVCVCVCVGWGGGGGGGGGGGIVIVLPPKIPHISEFFIGKHQTDFRGSG